MKTEYFCQSVLPDRSISKRQKCDILSRQVHEKCQKMSISESFKTSEASSQTVLPDRSILINKNWSKMPNVVNLASF